MREVAGSSSRDLEDDGKLQDAVLSVHHAALISMPNVPILKLIENNRDRRFLRYADHRSHAVSKWLGAGRWRTRRYTPAVNRLQGHRKESRSDAEDASRHLLAARRPKASLFG